MGVGVIVGDGVMVDVAVLVGDGVAVNVAIGVGTNGVTAPQAERRKIRARRMDRLRMMNPFC
jgi:hypothetical protein